MGISTTGTEAVSLPDHLLEEPDPCLCELHGHAQPCRECRWEHEEFVYECRKEEGR